MRRRIPVNAVVVTVEIERDALDRATRELNDNVVPAVSASPGFVAGYWLAPESSDGGGNLKGLGFILAETRQAAEAMVGMARSAPTPAGVTITDATIHEVVAHA